MSATSSCTSSFSYAKITTCISRNKSSIITIVVLAALAFVITGLLNHYKVIDELSTPVQWSFVGVGSFVMVTGIFMGLFCPFPKPTLVEQIPHKEESFRPDLGQMPLKFNHVWKIQRTLTIKPVGPCLHILSLNVCMLPAYVKRLEKMLAPRKTLLDNPVKRISVIADKINEIAPDIICFQEIFSSKATKRLCSLLPKYHIIHNVGSKRPVNSGIAFASRYPINEEGIQFHRYTNLGDEDFLSSKGVLRASVQINDHEVIFYVTHLQAKLGEKFSKIRKQQVEAVYHLIQQDHKKHPDKRIFFIGDLNVTNVDIKPLRDSQGKVIEEYTELKPIFMNFDDIFLLDHASKDYLRTNCELGRQRPEFEPNGSFYEIGSKLYRELVTLNQESVNLDEEVRNLANKLRLYGKIYPQVRYDYGFLYNPAQEGTPKKPAPTSFSEFQTWAYNPIYTCSPPYLSDHLILSMLIQMDTLFVRDGIIDEIKKE